MVVERRSVTNSATPAIAKSIGFEERGSHGRPLRHFQYRLYVFRSFLHLGGRREKYEKSN
jgi:hypothetical protein